MEINTESINTNGNTIDFMPKMSILINTTFKALAENDYKNFNRTLISTKYEILGVRMPALRKLAKEIAVSKDVYTYLKNAEYTTYEHIMLYGLVLGYLKDPELEEIFNYLDPLILKFDNWAHVDVIISSIKIFKKHPQEVLTHFLPLKTHLGEFTKRTFVLLLLTFYINEQYIETTLNHIVDIKQGQYYVDMAIAWTICEGLIKYFEKTIPLLQNNSSLQQHTFSKFVHNKAIQKARESYRLTPQVKEQLKELKIK